MHLMYEYILLIPVPISALCGLYSVVGLAAAVYYDKIQQCQSNIHGRIVRTVSSPQSSSSSH